MKKLIRDFIIFLLVCCWPILLSLAYVAVNGVNLIPIYDVESLSPTGQTLLYYDEYTIQAGIYLNILWLPIGLYFVLSIPKSMKGEQIEKS